MKILSNLSFSFLICIFFILPTYFSSMLWFSTFFLNFVSILLMVSMIIIILSKDGKQKYFDKLKESSFYNTLSYHIVDFCTDILFISLAVYFNFRLAAMCMTIVLLLKLILKSDYKEKQNEN